MPQRRADPGTGGEAYDHVSLQPAAVRNECVSSLPADCADLRADSVRQAQPYRFGWICKGRAFREDERGQVLPIVAFLLLVLLGFAGLVLDVGAAMIAQRTLQSSTDAAAMAAAQVIPAAAIAGASASLDPIAKARSYSSLSG